MIFKSCLSFFNKISPANYRVIKITSIDLGGEFDKEGLEIPSFYNGLRSGYVIYLVQSLLLYESAKAMWGLSWFYDHIHWVPNLKPVLSLSRAFLITVSYRPVELIQVGILLEVAWLNVFQPNSLSAAQF